MYYGNRASYNHLKQYRFTRVMSAELSSILTDTEMCSPYDHYICQRHLRLLSLYTYYDGPDNRSLLVSLFMQTAFAS